jgi:hypothetical protein
VRNSLSPNVQLASLGARSPRPARTEKPMADAARFRGSLSQMVWRRPIADGADARWGACPQSSLRELGMRGSKRLALTHYTPEPLLSPRCRLSAGLHERRLGHGSIAPA